MDIKSEKVTTIKLTEDEVGQLYAELQSVDFTDEEQPLMYGIWRKIGVKG